MDIHAGFWIKCHDLDIMVIKMEVHMDIHTDFGYWFGYLILVLDISFEFKMF